MKCRWWWVAFLSRVMPSLMFFSLSSSYSFSCIDRERETLDYTTPTRFSLQRLHKRMSSVTLFSSTVHDTSVKTESKVMSCDTTRVERKTLPLSLHSLLYMYCVVLFSLHFFGLQQQERWRKMKERWRSATFFCQSWRIIITRTRVE